LEDRDYSHEKIQIIFSKTSCAFPLKEFIYFNMVAAVDFFLKAAKLI